MGVVSRGLGATRGPKGTRLFNSKPLQGTNPCGWQRSKSNAAVYSGASRLRWSVCAGALWRPSCSQARGRDLGFPLSASARSAFPVFVQVKSGDRSVPGVADSLKVVESLSFLSSGAARRHRWDEEDYLVREAPRASMFMLEPQTPGSFSLS